MTDGNIGIYFEPGVGIKGDLVLELNDSRIKKHELNTLVASGGWLGSGIINVKSFDGKSRNS